LHACRSTLEDPREVTPLPSQGFPETSWLETRVAGTPLAPRVRLVSAPYALRAGSADQVPPSAAVTSLNSLTGNVTLAAGDNISLTQSGSTITLSGLNIPNPLPVSQSGAWNVGITGTPGTELEFVIMVIAVSCVKLLSAHNSTQHTSRKHKV
jgi:hypothetical protein